MNSGFIPTSEITAGHFNCLHIVIKYLCSATFHIYWNIYLASKGSATWRITCQTYKVKHRNSVTRWKMP